MLLDVAQRNANRVLDQDLVTAACIALIVSSILWVVLSRLILRNLRKAAQVPTSKRKAVKALWSQPPDPRRR